MAGLLTDTGINAQAAQRQVAPEELSQNQLNNMLGQDSLLMQRARNEGAHYVASRGLLNSSIAGEATQGAMIDRATPFALQDAKTYTDVSDKNLAAQNQFGIGRQAFGFDVDLQGRDLAWRSGENTLDRAQQATLQGASQNWTSGENALNRAQQTSEQQTLIAADQAKVAQVAALEIQRLGYAFSLDQKNVSSGFAATISQNTLNSINAILADANLSPASRTSAIDNIVAAGNSTLSWASKFYNMTVPALTPPA